ncbi:MAG: hypothetical protein HOE62_20525 [Alphaproteobacteria bacterium]|nr:hypothetical protein [Alphaproteobacteria bacterium]MBT5161425.1 hypothetical protein [Alphaproteobacteria bacterium]
MSSSQTRPDVSGAKESLFAYARKKGALAVGVADLSEIERIAPAGHRPTDLMPKVKSVISIGVGGQTQGAWGVTAKALSFFGSTESLAYKIAYGMAYYIENKFEARSIYCPPDLDPELGARYPLQSLKLHAEVAGIGARSLAGDILLHPDYGYMYFGSVFTELELEPDAPMTMNPCPAPSCVSMYESTGRTPCMKFCPVQCLDGEIDESGNQSAMDYDMAKCAEMTQQYEVVPQIIAAAIAADNPQDRDDALFGGSNKALWYKMSVGSGGLLAQCFECMRVCPVATRSDLADPIRRAKARREAVEGEPQ